ncbi:dynamin family protein [Jeotgalibacillus haloalkalitolerans]|uniref:Dynamin family protein n=1 Tax=Jeotgalibacillus haloalkalitolerans TaxID=3104292 RepID=A0ABU5KL25_9BACL|nr:dynamin family protein [Jeotgalibacillus sp. HH7-29]MDZ5711965.1 dynamin family protein [Jeotgalibacillus sp. HH7-29]
MNKADFDIQKDQLLSELIGFYLKSNDYGDAERAEKAIHLAEKLHREEIVIAFCGHFSAGKSAMINHLTGENLLPSSPIPTSANLIALHTGDEKPVQITTAENQIYELEPPLDETSIVQLGKEGLAIKRIDIWKNSSTLPAGVTLLDTPGIDSVDDAHKRSTESAVHLADLLFYVMDYNHVQSEMNFEYIRHMSMHNRKIYAVINQVDKHRDEELAFITYKNAVERAFFDWGAMPEKFFYTTLKKPEHPENQSSQLKNEISDMTENRYSLLIDSVKSSLDVLKSELKSFLEDEKSEILEVYSSIVTEEDIENKDMIYRQAEELEAGHIGSLEDWSENFDAEMNKMLQSSYLMPAEVRAIAENFLESSQPNFKAGGLFSGKKTKQEKEAREAELDKSLKAIIDEQLVWHAKTILYQFLERAGISRSGWSGEIEKISIAEPILIAKQNIKSGAGFTGEALLNYCDGLAQDCRKEIKSQMLSIKENILDTYEDQIEENAVRKSAEHTDLTKKVNVLKQIEELERKVNELSLLNFSETVKDEWLDKWSEEANVEKLSDLDHIITGDENSPENEVITKSLPAEELNEEVLLRNSLQLADEIKDINGFEQQSETLFAQAERLKNKQYTVALFGAFSAGKSSFANALLGEKILPVSPNPTTASINRIYPPDEQHPDQTVIVHFKQSSELLEDLQEASHLIEIKSLEEMAHTLPDVLKKNKDLSESKKSFIRAFLKGWDDYREVLGKTAHVKFEEFEGFVSNEHQSCFVEAIDLYTDSSVSDNGITLVDTPGADSVNARHTDVSFDYIRNSDAILFVTYFNHAFARADREFLIQMGRVKESFEHDKMFFIVNAADLAESEEEKQDVIQYVRKQLQTFGVKQPKIFGVSSLQALRNDKYSGLAEFQDEFSMFIDQELDSIVKKNTADYYDQTVERMQVLLKQMRANECEKAERKSDLSALSENLGSYFDPLYRDSVRSQTEQELKELLHYVHQRVFYRFSDFFKEAFNPAGFHGKSNKAALSQAMQECIEMVSFDFSQEFKVVNYRIEQQISKLYKTEMNRIWDQVKILFPEGVKPEIKVEPAKLLTFNQIFDQLDESDFNQEKSMFKNTKSFFEKNEKKFMQHALEDKFKDKAAIEIERVADQLTQWTLDEMSRVEHVLFSNWQAELSAQIDSALKNLYSEAYALRLETALNRISSYEN